MKALIKRQNKGVNLNKQPHNIYKMGEKVLVNGHAYGEYDRKSNTAKRRRDVSSYNFKTPYKAFFIGYKWLCSGWRIADWEEAWWKPDKRYRVVETRKTPYEPSKLSLPEQIEELAEN